MPTQTKRRRGRAQFHRRRGYRNRGPRIAATVYAVSARDACMSPAKRIIRGVRSPPMIIDDVLP